ncbi:MAG TPA: hypothetical protein VJ783_04055 [Pirellulales bacterium]|nr:hypothetical protein [Pirellulales bacterium]
MNRCLLSLVLSIGVAALAGCQPVASSATSDTSAAAADGAEQAPAAETEVALPADYAAAVQRITDYRDAIRAAVVGGDLEQAHHPLDEADVVLRRLPEIARHSGIPRRWWEQIVVASEDLNELWGQIHEAIDAHQTPDYSSLQEAIDDAVDRIASVEREYQVSRGKTDAEKP